MYLYVTYSVITIFGLRFLSPTLSGGSLKTMFSGVRNCRTLSHTPIPASTTVINISNTIPAVTEEAMATTGTDSTKAANKYLYHLLSTAWNSTIALSLRLIISYMPMLFTL